MLILMCACDNSDKGNGGEGNGNTSGGNDPFSVTSGVFQIEETDIDIPGRGFNLSFSRSYPGISDSTELGKKWAHNYNYRLKLSIAPNGRLSQLRLNNGTQVCEYQSIQLIFTIEAPSGAKIVFDYATSYTWLPTVSTPTVSQILALLPPGLQLTRPKMIQSFIEPTDGHRNAPNNFSTKPNDHSILIKNEDNTFTWRRKDGYRLHFAAPDGNFNLLSTDIRWRNQALSKLEKMEDRNSNILLLTYDEQGRISEVADASGRKITLTYLADKIEIADPLARIWQYYLENGLLVKVVDPLGNYQSYLYDASEKIIAVTDKRGYSARINYNASGKVATVTDALNQTMTITYSTNSSPYNFLSPSTAPAVAYNITTITYPNSFQETYTIDPRTSRVASIVDPSGLETVYLYDADANVIAVYLRKDGSTLRTLHYVYDSYGNMIKFLGPSGSSATITYNTMFSQPTSCMDTMGHKTLFSYDNNGNLITLTDASLNVTTYVYSSKGDLSQVTNPLGKTKYFGYDIYGNITSITNALGQTVANTRDIVGRITKVTGISGLSTIHQYNLQDKVISFTNEEGKIETGEYDENGNIIFLRDYKGNITAIEYDALNRVIQTKNQTGSVTNYSYDAVGNLVKITNSNGNSVIYEYGKAFNINIRNPWQAQKYQLTYALTKIISPSGAYTTHTYDDLGHLIQTQTPNGNSITKTYNSIDRITSISAPGNNVAFSYNLDGLPTQMVNSIGTSTLSYDQLHKNTQVIDAFGTTIQYAYDTTGNLAKITYPENSELIYNYDDAGRLSQITFPWGNSIVYTRNDSGQITEETTPNGVITKKTYDNLGRILSLVTEKNGIPLDSYTYSYDDNGNTCNTTLKDNINWSYNYDTRNALTASTKKQGTTILNNNSYSFDIAGNRLSLVIDGNTINSTYDSSDRLLISGTTYYSYDADGNMTSATNDVSTTTFVYDSFDRLIKVTLPNGTTNNFHYDPCGRRVEKQDSAGVTHYVTGNSPLNFATTNATNTVTDLYFFGQDSHIVARKHISTDEILYYHADRLGNVTLITNTSGAVVNSYSYDEYGNISSALENISNDYTFTGRPLDKDTGLIYNLYRYYDSKNGRFITSDPFEEIITFYNDLHHHKYIYSLNNPNRFTDPFGLFALPGDKNSPHVMPIVPSVPANPTTPVATTPNPSPSAPSSSPPADEDPEKWKVHSGDTTPKGPKYHQGS